MKIQYSQAKYGENASWGCSKGNQPNICKKDEIETRLFVKE